MILSPLYIFIRLRRLLQLLAEWRSTLAPQAKLTVELLSSEYNEIDEGARDDAVAAAVAVLSPDSRKWIAFVNKIAKDHSLDDEKKA